MGDADYLVPETILERPRRRLKNIEALRERVMYETEEIKTRIINVYHLLDDNIYNTQTDDGYLEIDILNYERCYDVQLE